MALSLDETIARLMQLAPASMQTIDEFHALVFAPWVKAQGLQFLEIETGRAKARLPQDPEQRIIEANVLKAGRTLAYGETSVKFEGDGVLVAHSTSEFSF